jgi:8-oxo-dGTP pyrophosphatase MutT (NUDIX family)
MSIEMISVIDDTGRVAGQVSREELDRSEHMARNVVVFVVAAAGVWVQKRSEFKPDGTPRKWGLHWDATACGMVEVGEEPSVAAARELVEESGIPVEPDSLEHAGDFAQEFDDPHDGHRHSRLTSLFVLKTGKVPKSDASTDVDEFRLITTIEDLNSEPTVPTLAFELDIATRFNQGANI